MSAEMIESLAEIVISVPVAGPSVRRLGIARMNYPSASLATQARE